MNSKHGLSLFVIRVFISGLFLLSGLESIHAQIIQGPKDPTVLIEQYGGCLSCAGSSWIGIQDAQLPDSIFASTQLAGYPNCFQGSCYYARGMMARNFGFNLPLNATITGIKAEVLRKAGGQNILDSTIVLLVNGMPTGTNKALPGNWPLTPAYASYGDSASLWGLSLSPAMVNDSAFGFMIKPYNKSGIVPSFVIAYLDHIRMTVYYSTPSGVQQQQVSGQPFRVWFNVQEEAVVIQNNSNEKPYDQIQIFTENGLRVYENVIVSGSALSKINTHGFASGLYIINIVTKDHQYAFPVSIER